MKILKIMLKAIFRLALWCVAAAILYLIVKWVGGEFKAKQEQTLAQTQEVRHEKIPVQVAPVRLGPIREAVMLRGDVQATTEVEVMSKVQGRVEELRLEDGTPIQVGLRLDQGARIAVLDHEELEAQVAQAEAGVAAAQAQIVQAESLVTQAESGVEASKAQLASAKATVSQAETGVKTAQARLVSLRVNLANLERDRTRLGNLYKEGVTTKKQLDDIETRYEAAKADYTAAESQVVEAQAGVATTEAAQEAAKSGVDQAVAAVKVALGRGGVAEAGLKQAEASLRLAQIRLGEATIKCPATGVVSAKHVDEGDMVGPNVPILTIIGIDPVKVVVDISEHYLRKVKEGTSEVTIRAEAFPDREFRGQVTRIHPSLDRDRRTVPAEIEVPNGDGSLKPGMFARVNLTLSVREGVPVIPANAVVRSAAGDQVFVLDSTRAKRRSVRLGLWSNERVEVTDGLQEGELIVVRGQANLYDDAEVEVVEMNKEE